MSAKQIQLSPSEIDTILSPAAIRAKAKAIYELAEGGKTNFSVKPQNFQATVDYVLQVIHKNYPDLNIPFHSRWGHFRAGGIIRTNELNQKISHLDPLEQARVKIDLVIPSVLLDAGAGMGWRFQEKGKSYSRSEGLGVASFHLFLSGAFSEDQKSLRTDSQGLKKVSSDLIRQGFQVTADNPLVGVDGRALLLQNLGEALENKKIFSQGRPGNIIDYLLAENGRKISAEKILRAVLDGLGPIWPGRLQAGNINLGDVWDYSPLRSSQPMSSLVPFHKLSQWLTYSLIEPIQDAGIEVSGVEKLTGLAEYRNGGLLIDANLIQLRDPNLLQQVWTPDSELVIEWRALTVYYLDQIGTAVQSALHKTPADFPLAKVLEGGTWWAGRFLAQDKRADGGPPLQIKSDGTVF